MPKITLSRESLEKSKNPTILDFLNRYKKNRIFTFDTSDRDPSEFGIEEGTYRGERVSDKGYQSLSFSDYHTPRYNLATIQNLIRNTDFEIPSRKYISTILPLGVEMSDITPAQLSALLENINQHQADLNSKIQAHDRNQAELEAQEAGLKEREDALDKKQSDINAEQVRLELEKADLVQKKVDHENKENALNDKIEKNEREEKAAKIYLDKIKRDMDALLVEKQNLIKAQGQKGSNEVQTVEPQPDGLMSEVNDLAKKVEMPTSQEPDPSGILLYNPSFSEKLETN